MSNPSKRKGTCLTCGTKLPYLDGRSRRRVHCSQECQNAARRNAYVPEPRKARPSLSDRLWGRVRKTANGCWEFTGYVDGATGYGQIGSDGRLKLTHRASWELTYGPIPPGLVVRHTCDNRPCINPGHLVLGTQADNVRDAVQRGRTARGSRHPHTQLSDDDVRAIRRAYSSGSKSRDLADKYQITQNYVTQIVRRQYRSTVV